MYVHRHHQQQQQQHHQHHYRYHHIHVFVIPFYFSFFVWRLGCVPYHKNSGIARMRSMCVDVCLFNNTSFYHNTPINTVALLLLLCKLCGK